LIVCLIFGASFISDCSINGFQFSVQDMIFMNFGYIGTSSGFIFLTLGIKYGSAGIVQAVENLKVTWMTLIIMVLSRGQKMPNLSQFFGMFCGVIGGSIIVLNKPQPKSSDG
jgi:drug/metabolite transporter (DMT)-like permease